MLLLGGSRYHIVDVKTMKLLILSDLHNDMDEMSVMVNGRRIDADADVVVLAGDIEEGMRSPE